MQPARYNFTVQQGSTWRQVFTLHQGDTDTPVANLTNYTASLVIKDRPSDSTPLLTLTSSSGITLGGTAGTITILQSATQTGAYNWANGEYKLTLTAPGGDTNTLLFGTVTLKRF